MLKITLKYLIFDMAISVFFNEFKKTFSITNNIIIEFKKGSKFSKMIIKYIDINYDGDTVQNELILYDGEITNIFKSLTNVDDDTIEVKYNSYVETVYDDDGELIDYYSGHISDVDSFPIGDIKEVI
jgi:hypothetical protein